MPSVREGRTRLLSMGTKPVPMPWEGSHPSVREKSMTSSRPDQKFGMDTPISASTMLVLSISEYCFFAEMIPIGMPIISATRIPATARIAVFGNRSITWFQTGMLFL